MKSLFVGNLSFKTTESELRTLFEPFGQLGRIHVPTDRENGRPRGFAFVEMMNDDAAQQAIAGLNGKVVSGRNINVNEARPKVNSGPTDRGGNKSGGRGRGPSRETYEKAPWQPREPRW